MGKHTQSIDNKIINRIYGHGKGWVFTPVHFSDLGSRDAVASALKRYRQSGHIRQLARGLYDYPRTDPDLGMLPPSPDAVARALAGRDAVRLQPSGAYAANLLGLSTQIPMKIVYFTDGRSRTVQIGKKTYHIEANHAAKHGNGGQDQRIGYPGSATSGATACG